MFTVETKEELELYHSGIKGMKWGIRRYQNPDGSLTPAGRKRYMKNPKWRAKYLEYQKQKIRESEAKKAAAKAKSKENLLKSSNANELYARRNELTTEEIMERVRRLQAEDSLSRFVKKEPSKFEKIKGGMDKVLDAGQSLYDFSQKPAGKLAIKQAKKYLGISDEPTRVDYGREIRNMAGLSDARIKELRDRIRNERQLRNYYNELQQANRRSNNPADNARLNNVEDELKKLRELLETQNGGSSS